MNENGRENKYFEFEGFRLSIEERLLSRNGERIPLTPRVLDLLLQFA